MAKVCKITDGTIEVDLLTTDWLIERGGVSMSPLTDAHIVGDDPVAGKTMVVSYRLAASADTHDDLKTKASTLFALLRKAAQYNRTSWQLTPVWIEEQARTETNSRKALVLRAMEMSRMSMMIKPADWVHYLVDVGLSIELEFPWQPDAPRTLPSSLLMSPFFQQQFKDDISVFDSVTPAWDGEVGEIGDFDATTDVDGDMNDSAAAAYRGSVGIEITFDNNTAAWGRIDADAVDQTSGVVPFCLDKNTLNMGFNAAITLLACVDGGGTARWYVRLLSDAVGAKSLDVITSTDTGAVDSANIAIPEGYNEFVLVFKRSTGADDGWTRLFMNLDLVIEDTGIDNDTRDWDTVRVGMEFTNATTFGGSYYLDVIKADPVGAPYLSKLAAVEGDLGIVIPIMDGTERYVEFTNPTSDKIAIAEKWFDPNTLAMTTADAYDFMYSPNEFVVQLVKSATAYTVVLTVNLDAGTSSTAAYELSDESQLIRAEVAISTGAGKDDGYANLYVGDVLQESLTDLDNDTLSIDEIRYGVRNTDAGTYGLCLMDGCKISYGRDPEPIRQHLANFRDDVEVTHVKNNVFGGAIVDVGLGDVLWTPVVANLDSFLFGSTDQPLKVVVIPKLSDAAVFTTSTLVLQYYNGVWGNLTLGTDYTCYPGPTLEDCFEQSIEDIVISIRQPSDAIKVVIDGDNCFWMQIQEQHAAPVYASHPYLSLREQVYAQRYNYFEIPVTGLIGDHPVKSLIRLHCPAGGGSDPVLGTPSYFLFGAKSDESILEYFEPWLNLGSANNPSKWATAYGADTATVQLKEAPSGWEASCDFGGDSTMVTRVTLTGDGMLPYYRGKYEVLLLYFTDGGYDEDVNMKVRFGIGGSGTTYPMRETKTVSSLASVNRYVVASLGEMELPFGEITEEDSLSEDLVIQIFAELVAGAPTLKMAAIMLLSINEWTGGLDDPKTETTAGPSALRGATAVDFDNGVIARRAQKYLVQADRSLVPAENWEYSGSLPKIEPDRKTRIYVLQLRFDGAWAEAPLIAQTGMHMAVEMYVEPGYILLRGDE